MSFVIVIFVFILGPSWQSYSCAFLIPFYDSLLPITFLLSLLSRHPHAFYDQAIVNGLNQHVALLQRENSPKLAT